MATSHRTGRDAASGHFKSAKEGGKPKKDEAVRPRTPAPFAPKKK